MRREIEGVLIEIIRGDITEQDTEAIVNAANSQLVMESGVAEAIKRRGGGEIEREAVSHAPIKVGNAVTTGAGRLKARRVIHAVGVRLDLRTDESIVASATTASLIRADEEGVTSISFPALGAGAGGLPLKSAARAMLGAAIEYVRGPTSLTLIRFVLFDEAMADVFRGVFEHMEGTK